MRRLRARHTEAVMVLGYEQHRGASTLQMTRVGAVVLRGFLVVGLLAVLSRTASAILVGTTPNVVPDTSTAPADDPGFLSVVKTGNFSGGVCTSLCFNGVYLGDGWVLSAKHTGVTSVRFDNSATTFTVIPNQAFI